MYLIEKTISLLERSSVEINTIIRNNKENLKIKCINSYFDVPITKEDTQLSIINAMVSNQMFLKGLTSFFLYIINCKKRREKTNNGNNSKITDMADLPPQAIGKVNLSIKKTS